MKITEDLRTFGPVAEYFYLQVFSLAEKMNESILMRSLNMQLALFCLLYSTEPFLFFACHFHVQIPSSFGTTCWTFP